MSLDRRLETYHELYHEAGDTDRNTVDEAFEAVRDVFQSYGWETATNDYAEDLVSAIVKYAVLSGNAIV